MEASRQNGSLRDRLQAFCRRNGIEAFYAFGSRAKEVLASLDRARLEPGRASDLDLAFKLHGNRRLSAREKAEMVVELENVLEADRVDLVALAEADPFLAVNIIRGERLHSEDDYATDEYELYVLRRAGDLAPFERTRIERILGSAEAG
jgi:predicted nucleotidyltransferase